ncbi:hypothetical protein BHT95_16520 [Bacillus paralicheniformis]|nr:hypothetical protein BHT95_16520 [Bacillus paralicheniformis]
MYQSLIKLDSDTQIKAMKNEAKREEHSEPDRASLAALVSKISALEACKDDIINFVIRRIKKE